MKTIKGKRYYVSIGHVPEEQQQSEAQMKDIRWYTFNEKQKSKPVIYVHDADPDNLVTVQLIPVNEIQKKDGVYKFRFTLFPTKLNFEEGTVAARVNIFGLFAVSEKDGMQIIEPVTMMKPEHTQYYGMREKSSSISIELKEDKIL